MWVVIYIFFVERQKVLLAVGVSATLRTGSQGQNGESCNKNKMAVQMAATGSVSLYGGYQAFGHIVTVGVPMQLICLPLYASLYFSRPHSLISLLNPFVSSLLYFENVGGFAYALLLITVATLQQLN